MIRKPVPIRINPSPSGFETDLIPPDPAQPDGDYILRTKIATYRVWVEGGKILGIQVWDDDNVYQTDIALPLPEATKWKPTYDSAVNDLIRYMLGLP